MSNQLPNDKVFVIIPVFNEGKVIGKIIESLLPFGFQIVVVDDGSVQNAGEVLGVQPSVHFFRHKINLGQGAALQTGIDFSWSAGADYMVTFDGDGQHTTKDLAAMLAPLQNGEADITLGSRFLEKDHSATPWNRKLVLKAGCVLNYLLTGIYLSDAHNGLRAFNRKAAGKIRIRENRMAHATELLFTIRRYKLRYQEVPARILYSSYSKTKGQSVFNSIRIAFDLVLHKLFE